MHSATFSHTRGPKDLQQYQSFEIFTRFSCSYSRYPLFGYSCSIIYVLTLDYEFSTGIKKNRANRPLFISFTFYLRRITISPIVGSWCYLLGVSSTQTNFSRVKKQEARMKVFRLHRVSFTNCASW